MTDSGAEALDQVAASIPEHSPPEATEIFKTVVAGPESGGMLVLTRCPLAGL
jgi:hypothetical protein